MDWTTRHRFVRVAELSGRAAQVLEEALIKVASEMVGVSDDETLSGAVRHEADELADDLVDMIGDLQRLGKAQAAGTAGK